MKQTTKAAILGVSLTLAASILVSQFIPSEAKAAVGTGVEQYKVYLVRGQGRSEERTLTEQDLNALAADGWKVRTHSGGTIILAK